VYVINLLGNSSDGRGVDPVTLISHQSFAG
jgi:hypothetical protein